MRNNKHSTCIVSGAILLWPSVVPAHLPSFSQLGLAPSPPPTGGGGEGEGGSTVQVHFINPGRL
jgi:hypothetical protein